MCTLGIVGESRRLAAVLAALVVGTSWARDAVLFVGGHPDDSEGYAATAFLLAKDYDLHVVDLTRGENGLGPAGKLDGSTARKRVQEERSACALLGATPHFLHEVNGDGCLSRASVDDLSALVTNLHPVAVFTHWPIDAHPDHVLAAAALARACRNVKYRGEWYYFEVQLHQTANWRPCYSVDVSATLGRKLDLLRRYVCQNPNDALARSNAERAALRGRERTPPVRHAETFTTLSGEPIAGGVLERLRETAVLKGY